jgi:hypothetical protein
MRISLFTLHNYSTGSVFEIIREICFANPEAGVGTVVHGTYHELLFVIISMRAADSPQLLKTGSDFVTSKTLRTKNGRPSVFNWIVRVSQEG